jgi:CheY-like chemotaxis protein
MLLKGEVPAVGQQRQAKVLCIDNHASSNYATFLLRRCGYEVKCVKSVPEALDLVDRLSFDVYLINDELACGSGKELLDKVKEAVASLSHGIV